MTVELFRALRHRITEGELPDVSAGTAHAAGLSRFDLIELFESQVQSRLIDLRARVLQARGDAYYTIGSAGHEGNAAIAKALRLTDPAFCTTAMPPSSSSEVRRYPGRPLAGTCC